MLRYEDVIASQSADDLIPLVIEEFSMADARVVYENNTPHLVIEFPDCFSCKYRIDDSAATCLRSLRGNLRRLR